MTRRQGKSPSKTLPPPKAGISPATPHPRPRNGRFIGRRMIAMNVDAALITIPLDLSGMGSPTSRWIVGIAALFVLELAGTTLVGTTPGKALLGLRIHSIYGDQVNWVRSLARTSVKHLPNALILTLVTFHATTGLRQTSLSYTLFALGWLALSIYVFSPVLLDPDGRGRHDQVAATVITAVRGASWMGRRLGGFQRLFATAPLRSSFKDDV